MVEYESYLEPFRVGSYITHTAHVGEDRTLCRLPVEKLTLLESVGPVDHLVGCRRCVDAVDAEQTPRLQAEQIPLLDWGGQDG